MTARTTHSVKCCALFGAVILLSATFAVLAQQSSDPYGGARPGSDVEAIEPGRLQTIDAPVQTKFDHVARANPLAAIISAGNGIYEVFIDDAGGSCGDWTALTAGLHPAGAGRDVLYDSGFPGTSYTTLRSYDTGTFYVTDSTGGATALCGLTAPVVTPILNGATTVGYSFEWTFADGGNMIRFTQDLSVQGPVDGTETVDNTVICETHTVENLGPGTLTYGLRKMWDWAINAPGFDDGPHFGDCQAPNEGCDRSMNLTADGSLDGFYPQSYIMNGDPGVAACPGGLIPNNPACGGNPLYVVAGTVTPPSNLMPPPDAPELLQFNSWPSLFSNPWQPGLTDNTNCPSGDNAIAYFYGLTAGTALTLAPGASESFTQYVVAGEDTCPEGIVPPVAGLDIKPGSCPNSWNRNSNGVLPVAVVGSDNFDVTQIDISTLQISRADGMAGSVGPNEGPPGPHTTYDDVATLFDGELCDCHELTGDGILDLMMHFKTQEVVAALDMDDFMPGSLVELTVSGQLLDGTDFSVSDCVRLVPPGTPPGQVNLTSNTAGAWVAVSPLDNTLDGGGFANFVRTYPQLTVLTLTAPESHVGRAFVGWRINGGPIVTQLSIPLVIAGDQTSVEVIYFDPRAPIAGPAGRVMRLD